MEQNLRPGADTLNQSQERARIAPIRKLSRHENDDGLNLAEFLSTQYAGACDSLSRVSPVLRPMIQLTRLNNLGLLVNCDLIKFVETSPDTVLTLITGEKILVRESPSEVLEKIVHFRRLVFARDEGRIVHSQLGLKHHADTSAHDLQDPNKSSRPEPDRADERGSDHGQE
jgi:flagellar protein FlbD